MLLARCNRTTPAVFSLANPSVNAQTIFSFSAVMAFHEALKMTLFHGGRGDNSRAPTKTVAFVGEEEDRKERPCRPPQKKRKESELATDLEGDKSYLRQAGVPACRDVVQLADILGHASVEATRIYLISSEAEHTCCMEQPVLRS